MSETALLKVENLNTRIYLKDSTIAPVCNLSFEVKEKEILCIIGESGCGKTMSMLSLTNLLPRQAKITSGSIQFNGQTIDTCNEKKLRHIRGAHISYIFQDPNAYLNPLFTVGQQIEEMLIVHKDMGRRKAREASLELLSLVHLKPAHTYAGYFPHQLSGGMNQRAMIAMAIASKPKLLIADEPTSSLDRITEIKILRLLSDLNKEFGLSIILITHNISIVEGFAHRVAIMYAGRIIESGSTDEILKNAKHPYTMALLGCMPSQRKGKLLATIPGAVADLAKLPEGCTFSPRCALSKNECSAAEPEFKQLSPTHFVKCCIV